MKCFAAVCILFSVSMGWSIELVLNNRSPDDWKEAPIVLSWSEGMPDGTGPVIARFGEEKLPVQVDDLDKDGKPDEIVFLASLKAGETKSYKVEPFPGTWLNVRPRAHTGMFMKNETINGMEGPGWESDLIAFRIYWDPRNATDVFCKTKPILSLDKFASKGHNYHKETEYGMDVLKVGTAVGIGGFGAFIDGKVEKVSTCTREFKVVADGPIRAACDLIYTDWSVGDRKLSLINRMNIFAGQDWAEGQITIKAEDGGPVPEVVAGFVKHSTTTLVHNPDLGVVGRWGKQALGSGEVPGAANLGLGVIADPKSISEMAEDSVNTYFKLKPENGRVRYRYNANWEKEPNAATSPDEYKAILERIARKAPRLGAMLVDRDQDK